MKLLLLINLLLCGCVGYEHIAVSKSGNYERDRIISLGGTSSQKGADGSSFVHDHQASFKDAVQAIGTAYSALQATRSLQSNNALSATKDTNATSITNTKTTTAAASKDLQTTTAAKETVTNKAIDAAPQQVGPINVNSP